MARRTALYHQHCAAGARMVDFAGYDMPLHYGSQLEEHHAVRRDCGMFDVSHMSVVDVKGPAARDFLRALVANDVDKLKTPGRALYACMLNARGGVMDDLIVYFFDDQRYRLVMNAATRDKDLAWLNTAVKEFEGVSIEPRADLGILAVQGPNARERVFQALGPAVRESAGALKAFHSVQIGELHVATTGYTGEDGFELIMPTKALPFSFSMLHEAGVRPIGLGARDTLRLEAGMNLYGTDMDETTTPLESGLAWTVAFEPASRRFIGRDALERQRADGVMRQLVGLVLEGGGVLRGHQKVRLGAGDGQGEGEITSGGFSPTLGRAIALGRVPASVRTGDTGEVTLHGGRVATVRVVKYPFVRNGKSCLE